MVVDESILRVVLGAGAAAFFAGALLIATPGRGRIPAVLLAAGTAVLGVTLWIELGWPQLVILREEGGAVRVAKSRLFGAYTHRFADGSTASVTHPHKLPGSEGRYSGDAEAFVFNDTARPMTCEEVHYGLSYAHRATPAAVPVHAATPLRDTVDYFGPDERPPESVSSKVGVESRRWLKW